MHSTPSQALRKDVARNRAALLAAAGEVFEREGLGAPLEDIAGAAGLSRASLARHFRTREDLVAALWEEDIVQIEAAAASVVNLPDGFLRLFDMLLGWQVDRRSIRPTLNQLQHGDLAKLIDRLVLALGSTLPAASRSGCARVGLLVEDLLLAIEMCAEAITAPRERASRVARWISARRLILPGLLRPEWLEKHPQVLEHPTDRPGQLWPGVSAPTMSVDLGKSMG